jgi:hypothetical protein
MLINRTRWTLLTATFIVGLSLAITQQTAHADEADCTGLSEWKSERTYKRGDFVWYPNGADAATRYRCVLDKCQGLDNHSEPGPSSNAWKSAGSCRSKPRS